MTGPTPPTPSAQRRRALVIEDEPLIAMGLAMVLEAMGFEIAASVETAADAVAAAHDHQPDLVLADVRLRGEGDGIDAVQVILAQRATAVIFLTGNPGQVSARGYGHLPVLSKPFSPALLRDTITAVLGPLDAA